MRRLLMVGIGLVWLAPVTASAQAPAAAPSPPPRHERTAELALVGTTGNADSQTLGVAGRYVYRPEPWVFEMKAGYIRNETEGTLSAESFSSMARADRRLTSRLSAFGAWDYLHDAFAGIDARNVAAGGLSYAFGNVGVHELIVDGGVGYSNEQRLTGADVSTAIALAGLGYRFKLSENAEISDQMRTDASLSDADDWRWNNVAAVSAKMTTRLSLKLSNTIRYVHTPAPGFETTDTITAVALVAAF